MNTLTKLKSRAAKAAQRNVFGQPLIRLRLKDSEGDGYLATCALTGGTRIDAPNGRTCPIEEAEWIWVRPDHSDEFIVYREEIK